MNILFDEDTPYPLKRHLTDHKVTTVPQMGWAGIQNGKLLALIQGTGCEVLLTCDQNMEYQQNLGAQSFATVVFRVPNKKMETLIPLVPQLLALLPTVRPGQVYHVEKSAEAPIPPP